METKTTSIDETDKENNINEENTASDQRKYYISPLHSDHSDFDDSDSDPHFISTGNVPRLLQGEATRPPNSSSSSSSSASSSSSSSLSSSDDEAENNSDHIASTSGLVGQITTEANASEVQEIVRGKKRVRNEKNWKSKIAKTLQNTGKDCTSSVKKQIPARKMGPLCGDKCRLNCRAKIDETSRQDIFNDYWRLGDLQKQRQFIIAHTSQIKPKYIYSSTQNFRKLNTEFYFELNHTNIRVSKTFF